MKGNTLIVLDLLIETFTLYKKQVKDDGVPAFYLARMYTLLLVIAHEWKREVQIQLKMIENETRDLEHLISAQLN